MAQRTLRDLILEPSEPPQRERSLRELILEPSEETGLVTQMTDEALRILSLPFRTFSEEATGGAEQMGQGINAALRGEPGSAAWNIGIGGLRSVGAPITAATRTITDPGSRLLQALTGISEPTREMVQTGGDILGGAALPAGIGAVRGLMAAPGAAPAVARSAGSAVPISAIKPGPISPASALSRPVQEGLSEAHMAQPLVKEITSNAAEAVQRLAAIDPNKGRLFRYVQAALEDGTLAPEGVVEVMRKYDLSNEEFARFFADSMSAFGRGLGRVSHLRRQLNQAFKNEPAAQQALDALGPMAPMSTTERLLAGWRSFDNAGRAMLVTQWTTAIRNAFSQAKRYSVDMADTALTSALEGKPMQQAMQDGLENFTAVVHRLSPTARKQLERILGEYPVEAQQLAGTIAGEATLTSKFSHFINPLNKAQEGFFRTISFDSKLRQLARDRNLDLGTMAPKDIPSDLIEQATRHALEITFAASPTNPVGKAILRAYHDIPGLTTINPFPRFHLNALKFLWDFSPIRMFTPSALNTIATGTPKEAAAVISRGLIGQSMLATAMAVRSSDLAGLKWHDIRVPGTNQFVDTRAFGPFNVYLLLAEGLLRPDRLDTADWAKGLVGINRVAGTGLVLTDALQGGTIEQKRDTFYRFVGEYFGRFGVPLRNLKSSIESLGTTPEASQERVIRSRRDFPLIDPMLGNVPGLSQQLPEFRSGFQGGTQSTEFPATKQFTGMVVRRKNLAEQEAERLGLSFRRLLPSSGIPEWDRAVLSQLGPIVEQVIPAVVASAGYDRQSPDVKRFTYMQVFSQLRQQAIKLAAAQSPKLAAQARLKGVDPDLRSIIGIGQRGTYPGLAEEPSIMDQLRQRLSPP